MRVKFIGTGQLGTQRRCTSFLVNDSVLFDIGNGTIAGLLENRLDVKNIKLIVISHFHGDHFGDIVYFLHRRAAQGLTDTPLVIIGPKGLQQKVIDFNNFLFGDIRNYADLAKVWNIHFVELGNGGKIVAGEFEIHSFKVVHSKSDANGYIISSGSKAIGYTGDACMSDSLMEQFPGARNWIVDANELMRKEGSHIGFSELIGLADMFKDINFYAVHRKDYDTSSNVQINLIVPMDDDGFLAK